MDAMQLASKFVDKLEEIRTNLGEDGYEQFIKGLTPDVLANSANSELISDLYMKCLAAGERDE